MDEAKAIEALAMVYEHRDAWKATKRAAEALVNQDRFRWRTVGESFRDAMKAVV
jgi:hypothetical protein